MKKEQQFFIDGVWSCPPQRGQLPLINPATEATYGNVILGNASDVDQAVIASRRAFTSFSVTPVEYRIDLLRRIVEGFSKRLEEIGANISEGMGAPLKFAIRFQAGAGLAHFKQILAVLEAFEFEKNLGSTRIVSEPIGVCGMIVPWNWPMNQIACKVAPALAAGCTMVVKPSEVMPGPVIILGEILEEAGVPPGVFNIVQGEGPVVGAAIAAHPEIDMISFTGSTNAGISVAELAAKSVKRVCQELGGKAPNILLDDADFETAVARGIKLCFRNSGQSCNSPSRMLVPEANLKEVILIAKKASDALVVGDPNSSETEIGPVVSQKQWASIQAYIQSGIDEGATLVTGGVGRPAGLDVGFYVQPTVFANVRPDMRIAKEEIFGPVLSILSYDNLSDAVSIANDTHFGLAAYVESSDERRAQSIGRLIRAGMVHLNGAGADPAAPFGGFRKSGNGREWGIYGLEEFIEVKAVMGFNVS